MNERLWAIQVIETIEVEMLKLFKRWGYQKGVVPHFKKVKRVAFKAHWRFNFGANHRIRNSNTQPTDELCWEI